MTRHVDLTHSLDHYRPYRQVVCFNCSSKCSRFHQNRYCSRLLFLHLKFPLHTELLFASIHICVCFQIISFLAVVATIEASVSPFGYSAYPAYPSYSFPFAYPYALPAAYSALPAARAVAPVAPFASAPLVNAVPAGPFVRALPAVPAVAPVPVARAVAAPFTAPVARAVAAPFTAPVAPVASFAAPVAAAKIDYADAYPQYQYAYNVQDTITGDSKAQEESREGDVVKGRYSLIEADGSRRTVNYYADPLNGFNAIVQKELPVVAAAPIVKAAPAVVSV